MRLLLGSGGFRTPQRFGLLLDEMRSLFGPIRRILFVPYAIADHNGYVERLTARGYDAGYELVGIHRSPDPIEAVDEAEGIYVGGGNSFRLLNDLYRHELLEPIRRRIRAGVPYLGISAGANVACPTIKTTNDMPIVYPPSLDALGLVDFQINPHYFSGLTFVQVDDRLEQHFGETRHERIAEFHQMNQTPVIGLREGGLLRVVDGAAEVVGASARMFLLGRDPYDVEPRARIWPPEGV